MRCALRTMRPRPQPCLKFVRRTAGLHPVHGANDGAHHGVQDARVGVDQAFELRALQHQHGLRAVELQHRVYSEAVDLPLGYVEDGRVIVAEAEDGFAGFACLLPCVDGVCELDGMFVEPDRWRGGVGRRLLDAASELALREGARSIHVVANPAALAFYHACGFQDSGIAETRFGPAQTLRMALCA